MYQGSSRSEGAVGCRLRKTVRPGNALPHRCQIIRSTVATVLVATVSTAACGDYGGSSGGTAGSNSSGATTSTGGTEGAGASISRGGGGIGGANGGGGVTSLSGSRLLSDLTPAEATQLCNEAYAYLGTAISQATLCKAAGLTYTISSSAPTDAVMQENCTNREAECLVSDPYVPNCREIPSPCTATVADYSTCVADQAAAYNSTVSGLPNCAEVASPDRAAIWDFVADLPDSCSALSPVCPGLDFPSPRVGEVTTSGSGGTSGTGGTGVGSGGDATGGTGAAGGTGGIDGSGGAVVGSGATGGIDGTGGDPGSGGNGVGGDQGTGGDPGSGGAGTGGDPGSGGADTGGFAGGAVGGTGGVDGSGGSAGSSGGTAGSGGSGDSTLPGDVAEAAGNPVVAAHAMTRALFASYDGPLFTALRVSDNQEMDIGVVASGGLVDVDALEAFCSGTSCKLTALYDQSGNGNDMWRGDTPDNAPMDNNEAPKLCDLMDIEYWQMSDGTRVPIALEHGYESGLLWKDTSQCLRNRDRTNNMPVGADPQTEYAIFHNQYANANCCFNYGNTGNLIHYTGPGTLSAIVFSSMTFWSKGLDDGPWPMFDWEQGVYAGNICKCNSGAGCLECTATGENPNPSVYHDIVTMFGKHNGVDHWQLKSGNAQEGALMVNIDEPALPAGYSPLRQEGGLGLGEGGAGDPNGSGGFSEGAVIAGETSDATDDAIQASIVSVYGR